MADLTSLISLIVALVALLVAFLQALQQYSATADGYRRCQKSVMGKWSKHTHRRFKWKRGEFRFETVFAVPEIVLLPAESILGLIPINGSKESMELTMVASVEGSVESLKESALTEKKLSGFEEIVRWKNSVIIFFKSLWEDDELAGNELTSWLTLLSAIHRDEAYRAETGKHSSHSPHIKILRKSWDFMPPEVIKPYAMCTLHDIIIICQRLGLSWKTIDLGNGNLQAEGDTFVVTSSVVRSLGIVMSFINVGRPLFHRLTIQSPSAACFTFGYLPLDLWFATYFESDMIEILESSLEGCIYIGTEDAMNKCLKSVIGLTSEVELKMWDEHLTQTKKGERDILLFAEFVAIAGSACYQRGQQLSRVENPAPSYPWPWQSQRYSVGGRRSQMEPRQLSSANCFVPFLEQLNEKLRQEIIPNTDSMKKILSQCEKIIELLSTKLWIDSNVYLTFDSLIESGIASEILDVILEAWDKSAVWLSSHTGSWDDPVLVCFRGHLKAVLEMGLEFRNCVKELNLSDPIDEAARVGDLLMKFYFEKSLTEVIDKARKNHMTEEKVEMMKEIWVTMIFKGICWYNLHGIGKSDNIVDPKHFQSKHPIYIG